LIGKGDIVEWIKIERRGKQQSYENSYTPKIFLMCTSYEVNEENVDNGTRN